MIRRWGFLITFEQMLKVALIVCFLMPGLVHAVICKVVDTDGVVAYVDTPASECRTPVNLRGLVSPPVEPEDARRGYRSLRIVHPSMDEEVGGNAGRVALAMELEPALRSGHRIRLFLDGALVPDSFAGLLIELTGVDEGRHSVRAAVFDGNATRVIDSETVRFFLHEAVGTRPVSGFESLEAN